jgi:hypothetical protein
MAEDLVTLVDPPVFVTHDETAGLQNSTETPSPPNPAGDADDDDVLFASIPGVFSTRLGELTSATPIGAAESPGNVVTFNPTGTLGNIALTDADGNPLDGDDSGLVTTDGDAILLYTDENDNIVLGKTADDTLVFAIYLEETGGSPPTGAKLWTVQYLAIDHGDDGNDPDSAVDLTGLVHVTAFEEQDFSFANAPAGQNLFMMFGNASQAILVTGEDPANESAGENVSNDGDTVNTGKGGGATTLGTEGQQIKAQKALVVTFVTGGNPDYIAGPGAGNDPGQPLSQTEADDETNIDFTGYVTGTRAAEFTISQMTPGAPSTTATVELEAYLTADGTGDNYIDNNPLVQGDDQINIDSVEVIRGGVNVVGTQGVDVEFIGDAAVITGVKDGDIIRYTTETDHNRVLIRNDQPAGSNVAFDLGGFTLSQVAGDTDEVGSLIFFEDDGPSITTGTNPTALTVDETTLGTDASGSFASLFNVAFGTDGPKDTDGVPGEDADAVTFALGIGVADADSGLDDTATGNSVFLFLSNDGTTITGKEGTDLLDASTGETVFVISVNADTGVVTLDQQRAVIHTPDTGPDQAVTLADNVITLTATATDGDLDTTSHAENVGDRFTFEDDAPLIITGTNPTALTVDETTLGMDASGSFASLFNVAFGNDGPKDTDGVPGEDADAVTFALGIGVVSADSGLIDTATGNSVFLFLSNDGTTITGKEGTDLADAGLGDTVFVITVNADTGVVTLDQQRAVVHPTTDPDEAVTLADNVITLTAIAKDGDLDTASRTENVGDRFTFKDDGPTVTVENATGTYDAGAAGTWIDLPGADGFGSLGVTFDSYEIDTHGTVTTTPTNSNFTQTDVFAFEGSITDDFNADGTDDTVEFTLTFDPNFDTYVIDVTTPPSSIITFDTSQGTLKAGGPDPVRTLLFGGSEAGADDIVFFAVVPTAPTEGVPDPTPPTPNDIEDLVVVGATDLDEGQIEALSVSPDPDEILIPGLITPETLMNVSTAGIGVNNNNLNGAADTGETPAFANTTITSGDESFVVNPETVVDKVTVFIDNSVGGYNPATEDLYYTVYYTDGTVSGPTDVTNPLPVPQLDPNNEFPDALQGHGQFFVIDGGDKQIDAVQLTMGSGTIKIPVIAFSVEQVFEPESLRLDFMATLVDGDGDNQQDPFSVLLV